MSRYIDADELYVDWYDSFVADDGTVYDNFPLISKEQIDNAPTIEPKHGEWINKNGHTHYCSVCGFEETEWYTKDYNFCPHCGADMRGKNDD